MRKYILLIILFFILINGKAIGQKEGKPFSIDSSSLRFPFHHKLWGFKIGAGLQMVLPPKDLLENAIQAPLVNIHMNFGMPWKFSLEADVSTIIVSSQVAIGPHLGFNIKNFGVNIGWDFAFFYGQMKQGGFDNRSYGWIQYPNLSLGYKLKDMAFTLKGEIVYVTRVSQSSGENTLTRTKDFYNGFTVGLYIEQRLWKNHVFIIGLKDNYEKFFWPTWMLFTTFNRYYHIPELSFTWIL
jgi:hypothetical protein